MLEERLNYLSTLSIENDITKSMSYEEAIKDSMQPKKKKGRQQGINEECQAVN